MYFNFFSLLWKLRFQSNIKMIKATKIKSKIYTFPSKWSFILRALLSNSAEKSDPEFPADISEGSGPMTSSSESSSLTSWTFSPYDAEWTFLCKWGGKLGPIIQSCFELWPLDTHAPLSLSFTSLLWNCFLYKCGGRVGPITEELSTDFNSEVLQGPILTEPCVWFKDDLMCGGREGPMHGPSSSSEVESGDDSCEFCRWGGSWGPIPLTHFTGAFCRFFKVLLSFKPGENNQSTTMKSFCFSDFYRQHVQTEEIWVEIWTFFKEI